MPIRDPEARNIALSFNYGPDPAANAPTYYDVALFDGDPMLDPVDGGGTEITGDGYARARVYPADFTSDGAETWSTTVTFDAPTGEWGEATHYSMLGSDGYWWDTNELAEPLVVTGAGDGPIVEISIYFGDAVTTDEEP